MSRSLHRAMGIVVASAVSTGCFADFPEWSADAGADDMIDAGPPALDEMVTDGSPDVGPSDAALDDAAPIDALAIDAHLLDAIPPDVGDLDASWQDRSVVDAAGDASVDAARDAVPVDSAPLPDAGAVDSDLLLDAAPPAPEVCNGLDDDQNGVIDDAPVCGRVIAQHCRLYLGWAKDNAGPDDGSESWGTCPEDDVDDFFMDDLACRGTRGESRFRRISMGAGVDDNDDMGVAFRCSGGPPGVAEWVQSACEVWLGQADNNLASGAEAWDGWGGCVARAAVGEGPDLGWTCVSSGGDGLFHRISLIGAVDGNDAFAVAFRCVDPDDPQRAAAAQASAAAFLTWDKWSLIGDGVEQWSDCPGDRNDVTDNSGDERCASSAFDGRFHRFEVTGNVDSFDAFGIALLPHPDAP